MTAQKFSGTGLVLVAIWAISLPGCGRPEGRLDISLSLHTTPAAATRPLNVVVVPAGAQPSPDEPGSRPNAMMAAELARALARIPEVKVVPFGQPGHPVPDSAEISDEALAKHIGEAAGAQAVALVRTEKFRRITDEKGARQTDLTFRVRIIHAKTGKLLAEGTADVHAEGGYEVEKICRKTAEAMAADLRERIRPAD